MPSLPRSLCCALLLLSLTACSGPVPDASPPPAKTTGAPARSSPSDNDKKPATEKRRVPVVKTRDKIVGGGKKPAGGVPSRFTLAGHASTVSCVAFSRDGK